MSLFTRRQALSGIAATSIGFLLACRNKTEVSQQSEAPPKNTSSLLRLNVFLHGLAVIEVSPSSLDQALKVTFPEVTATPAHVYKAGNLDTTKGIKDHTKLLTKFDPGSYQLQGIIRGTQPPVFSPATINFVIPNADHSITVSSSGKRIFFLPRPTGVYCLRQAYRKKTGHPKKCDSDLPIMNVRITGDPNGKIDHISTVHLFTYVCDTKGPQIVDSQGNDFGWKPVYVSGIANLHIFAEPETSPGGPHARDAFDEMMKVLYRGGQSLYSSKDYKFIDYGPVSNVGTCDETTAYDGVTALDLQTLPQLNGNLAGEMANCLRSIIYS